MHAQEQPAAPESSSAAAALPGAANKSGSAIEGLGESPAADNKVPNSPPANDSTKQSDKVQLGGSYIGVQTEKTVRVIDPAKPTDCANDDDCMDYTNLHGP